MLMLKPPAPGLSLIELVIGMAIISMLIAAGLPAFVNWMQNAQIRTAAEGLRDGLQLARAEAVRRNTPVRFQLTTSLDSSCAVSRTGTNWVVSLNSAAGRCDATPAEPPALPAAPDAANPYIVRVGTTSEGQGNVAVSSTEVTSAGGAAVYTGTLTFNGWGRIVPTNTRVGNSVRIDITKPAIGACATSGSAGQDGLRCLRLIVSSTGQISMCDPYLSTTTPGGCP